MKWMICLAVLAAALAVACSGSITGTVETRDDRFVVAGSPRIVVKSGNGRIVVNPGPDGTVRVQATLKKPDGLEYETNQEGDIITIEVIEKSRGIFNIVDSPGADIEITAPSSTMVELRTSNGAVEVFGMRRSGNIHTSNGKVVMQDVAGNFEISTSNGSVKITLASGTFDVETSNGRIDFDGDLVSGGDNRMRASNGSVDIKLRGTPSVKLDASTSNGSVDTRLPILTTSPGDPHRLVGTIGTGDAELFVETSNGSVVIR